MSGVVGLESGAINLNHCCVERLAFRLTSQHSRKVVRTFEETETLLINEVHIPDAAGIYVVKALKISDNDMIDPLIISLFIFSLLKVILT